MTCYQNVIRLQLLTLKEINKAKASENKDEIYIYSVNELTSEFSMKKLATFFKINIYFWKGGGVMINKVAFFLSKTDFQ